MIHYKMNFKKYTCYTFALLLFSICACKQHYEYKREEEAEYYTKNAYKLEKLGSAETSIILISSDEVPNFTKKLKKGIPKWLVTGQEKKPYELWKNFFNQELKEQLLKNIPNQNDRIDLEDYFKKFGHLIEEPTEKNEKALIEAIKKLEANYKLMELLKALIVARYNNPETICISEATLEYQEFIHFILNDSNKNNTRRLKIEKVHADLVQWKHNGYPSGIELWKTIQKNYREALKASQLYRYKKNKEAIEELLRLMDHLADHPYSMTYRDLLSVLPNGIDKLKGMLSDIGLEEKKDIKLLKIYLDLTSSLP